MDRRRSGRHHSVAHLSALQPPLSSRYHCRPSPCDRLSRPRTTTTAPPHPWPVGRRCAQPGVPRWPRGPGQTRGGSRVHLSIARRRRHPTRPLRHRRGYPAARHPGLPSVPPTCRGVPRLRDEEDGCASPPAQIRQVRAGASLRGVDVGFSRMPFRHARHTRAVRQYRHAMALSGLLPPAPAPPGAGCPQLRSPAATEPRSRSLTSTRSTSASRRTGGKTRRPSCGSSASSIRTRRPIRVRSSGLSAPRQGTF